MINQEHQSTMHGENSSAVYSRLSEPVMFYCVLGWSSDRGIYRVFSWVRLLFITSKSSYRRLIYSIFWRLADPKKNLVVKHHDPVGSMDVVCSIILSSRRLPPVINHGKRWEIPEQKEVSNAVENCWPKLVDFQQATCKISGGYIPWISNFWGLLGSSSPLATETQKPGERTSPCCG